MSGCTKYQALLILKSTDVKLSAMQLRLKTKHSPPLFLSECVSSTAGDEERAWGGGVSPSDGEFAMNILVKIFLWCSTV